MLREGQRQCVYVLGIGVCVRVCVSMRGVYFAGLTHNRNTPALTLPTRPSPHSLDVGNAKRFRPSCVYVCR